MLHVGNDIYTNCILSAAKILISGSILEIFANAAEKNK